MSKSDKSNSPLDVSTQFQTMQAATGQATGNEDASRTSPRKKSTTTLVTKSTGAQKPAAQRKVVTEKTGAKYRKKAKGSE